MTDQLDEELKILYLSAIASVDKSLKSINITLNLNRSKLAQRKVPEELNKLLKWKEALEFWKGRYANEKNAETIAESIGIFHEICSGLR